MRRLLQPVLQLWPQELGMAVARQCPAGRDAVLALTSAMMMLTWQVQLSASGREAADRVPVVMVTAVSLLGARQVHLQLW